MNRQKEDLYTNGSSEVWLTPKSDKRWAPTARVMQSEHGRHNSRPERPGSRMGSNCRVNSNQDESVRKRSDSMSSGGSFPCPHTRSLALNPPGDKQDIGGTACSERASKNFRNAVIIDWHFLLWDARERHRPTVQNALRTEVSVPAIGFRRWQQFLTIFRPEDEVAFAENAPRSPRFEWRSYQWTVYIRKPRRPSFD